MLLSRSCVYGIRALIYLAMDDSRPFISIKELSNNLDISFHFLTKTLQILSHNQIVVSAKGTKGGVALNRLPEKINVYDIVVAIDGDAIFEECVLGLPGCADDNPCPLHSIWRVTKEELRDELKSANLKILSKDLRNGKIRLSDVPNALIKQRG